METLYSIFVADHEPQIGDRSGRYNVQRCLRVYRSAGELVVDAGWLTRVGREWWWSPTLPRVCEKRVDLPARRLAVNTSQVVEARLHKNRLVIADARKTRYAVELMKRDDEWVARDYVEWRQLFTDGYVNLAPIMW